MALRSRAQLRLSVGEHHDVQCQVREQAQLLGGSNSDIGTTQVNDTRNAACLVPSSNAAEVNSTKLNSRDGAAIRAEAGIVVTAQEDAALALEAAVAE